MNAQVENVLKTAQFKQGELSLKTELININELVAKVTNTIAIQVEKREGKISCHFDSEQPLVNADPSICQMLFPTSLITRISIQQKSRRLLYQHIIILMA